MKDLAVWCFDGYKSWQQQLNDEINKIAHFWNRQERKEQFYERYFNVLEKAAKENRCFCEMYDRYGDLCLTTRYSRNNNGFKIKEEEDGRVIKALLSVKARKSSLRKADATGPYVLCFYMKDKGNPPKLLYKEKISGLKHNRLLMDDKGVKYNKFWVFHYDITEEVWSACEVPKKEFCEHSLFFPEVKVL